MKPILLYTHSLGPNPWKTAIVLEELNLPYENKFVDPVSVKQEPFTKLNPNGRVPCIEDHNTGIVLWESGAINEYLVETYDPDGKIWYQQGHDRHYMKQWLYFQMTGQGPYYGQAAWFTNRHSELLPSARDRYRKEVHRVLGVLNSALTQTPYLVGDKCTIADLAFITWDIMIPYICDGESFLGTLNDEFPHWTAWHRRLLERPAVQRALRKKQESLEQAGPEIYPTALTANDEK